VRLHEIVKKNARRGEKLLKLWRPGWPKEAYLEVQFDEKGIIAPMGAAVLTDGNGMEVTSSLVALLYAPVADDYEEGVG